nr:uncharacterized protein LOC124211128 [Neodiprion pinetum]
MPEGVTTIGFADDVALVVTARTAELLECKANEAISSAWAWLAGVGLDLAKRKTEIVVITRRHSLKVNPIKVKGHEVKPTDSVKYLGVTIDARLNFAAHVRQAANKAMGEIGRGPPAVSATMPGSEGARVRMTYGDVNYVGNNRAILYLRRRFGGQQMLTNSCSPLNMQPPGLDIVVLDGVVFTADCQCISWAEHERMFPHYRSTVDKGVTCSDWRLERTRTSQDN